MIFFPFSDHQSHSRSIQKVVKSQLPEHNSGDRAERGSERCLKDNLDSSNYASVVCSTSSSPSSTAASSVQPQHQHQQHTFHRQSHYDQDYFATEV